MADRSGKQLGNYRLVRLLGKGGFAEVYLGEHVFLKTPVAVKLLRTQLESEDMTGFLQEAQMIARLQHAHIVRVTDFGMDGDLPYLVMDFAPNGTLRQRHPRGTTLPLVTVTSYIKQVADALQYAHNEKLIHRDIKPENMLLARNNTVLLSDFGIATVAHRTSTQNTSIIAGTAVYMAPELFRGRSYPASDQYALATVVYEWLAGQPPFYEGDFIQLGYQHTYVPPEPLSEKVPSIPKDVEFIVNTALSKDPKQRFGSVQAFANALEHASQGGQGYAAPVRPASTPLPPTPTPTPASPVATEEYKPPMKEASFASTGSYVGGVTSKDIVKPKPVTEVPIQKSESLWRIGKKQVVAMLIGSGLIGLLSYIVNLIAPGFSSPLYNTIYSLAIGNIYLGVSTLSLLYILIMLLAFSFGSIYGPWVSLVMLLVRVLFLTHFTFTWSLYIGYILIGFISGLALMKTKGDYTTLRPRFTASFISVVAVIIGYAFYYFLRFTSPASWRFFLNATIPIVILTFILLPILLTFYNRWANRSRKV